MFFCYLFYFRKEKKNNKLRSAVPLGCCASVGAPLPRPSSAANVTQTTAGRGDPGTMRGCNCCQLASKLPAGNTPPMAFGKIAMFFSPSRIAGPRSCREDPNASLQRSATQYQQGRDAVESLRKRTPRADASTRPAAAAAAAATTSRRGVRSS